MLRFAVGYQGAEPGEESFAELVAPFAGAVAEVFFAWPGQASGRAPVGAPNGRVTADFLRRFEADLLRFRGMGLRLDVLFNANCYGGAAMSVALAEEVLRILRRMADRVGGADVVTTTSPAIAWIVKRQFPAIDVRASVNMRIGSVAGMAPLADRFDSFHVRRDCNRDLDRLRDLRTWADSRGKRLVLLANSGCLRDCAGQTFHDNLVAHETEVAATRNLPGFLPYTCWGYLKDRAHWPAILQATWIRPEDLHHYEGLVDLVKLATRLHERPQVVIGAYVRRHYAGNTLDLFEPGFSPLVAPHALDNRRFPDDWFATVSRCDRRCHRCGYCAAVLERTLVPVG